MDAEAVARVLESVPMFNALADAERTELVPHFRARRFSRDEVVFHRDDAGGHLYVILSGSVKVAIPDEEGHEVVVAVERNGAVFGELALFDDAPRSATVTALDETQVVTLAREDFLRLLERVSFSSTCPAAWPSACSISRRRRRAPTSTDAGRPRVVRWGDPGVGESGSGRSRGAGRDLDRTPPHHDQGARSASQAGPLLSAS